MNQSRSERRRRKLFQVFIFSFEVFILKCLNEFFLNDFFGWSLLFDMLSTWKCMTKFMVEFNHLNIQYVFMLLWNVMLYKNCLFFIFKKINFQNSRYQIDENELWKIHFKKIHFSEWRLIDSNIVLMFFSRIDCSIKWLWIIINVFLIYIFNPIINLDIL